MSTPTSPETEPSTGASPSPSPRDRRRFAAALVLFAAWIAFLVGLAVTDSQRPMERAGTVPEADRPAEQPRHEHVEE